MNDHQFLRALGITVVVGMIIIIAELFYMMQPWPPASVLK